MRQGLSLSGACALVGNFCQEVGPDLPTAFRRTRLDHGSQGLAQWRLQRLTNYLSFVRSTPASDSTRGRSFEDLRDSLNMQALFVMHELTVDYPALHRKLAAGGDVAALTADVCWQYERPNKALSGIERRIAHAKALLVAVDPLEKTQSAGGLKMPQVFGVVDHLQAAATSFDTKQFGAFGAAASAAVAGIGGSLLTPLADMSWWIEAAVIAALCFALLALIVGIVAGRHATAVRQAIGNVTPDAPPAEEVKVATVIPPADPDREREIMEEVERRMAAIRQDKVQQPSADYSPAATGDEPMPGQALVVGNDATMTIGRAQ